MPFVHGFGWIVEVLTLALPTGHSDTAADVVKYSSAFRHEWHARRTVVLVFFTKPWREQKGHLLVTNVRVPHPVEELQATPEALVHIWTSQLEHCPPCLHFVVKFMKAAGIAPPILFIYGLAVSCACSIKFILLCSDSLCILESSYSPPVRDTKAASGST